MDQSNSQLLGVRLVRHTFSLKLSLPIGDYHPHCSQAKPTHRPKRHLNRFSRFCMGPKSYAVQCIVSGEENPQNCPFPLVLVFRHPAGGGPSHGRMQHVQKLCSGDILADGHTDTHIRTDYNTLQLLVWVK